MLALWQDGGGTLWRGQYKGATAGLRAASATTWSLLISTASIAASLRSTCGPARKAPESCTQAFPVATPHRGHGTPDNCFAVMSLIRIGTACNKPNRQAVRNGTHCLSSVAAQGGVRAALRLGTTVQTRGPVTNLLPFVGKLR